MSWWVRAKAGAVLGGLAVSGGALMAQVAAVPPPVPPTAAEMQAAAQPTHDATWWKHAVV